jgi:tRNA-dihydrouridine synthase
VIANGDINTPQKARFVLDYTGADGVMIGRAAQGGPGCSRNRAFPGHRRGTAGTALG